MEQEPWDLAVVGAGPAGSVCACSALGTHEGIRVALIDRETFPRDKPCGDAIRQDAVSVLEELKLNAIFAGRSRIERSRLTFPHKFQYLKKLIDFDRYTYYIVERKLFDTALYEAAIQRGAHDLTGYTMNGAVFDESAGLWNLTIKQRRGCDVLIRARVLVGADGASSRVRRVAGLELNSEKHVAVGVRAYAQLEGFDEGALHIDFLGRLIPGYGWIFPLQNNKVNIGLGLDIRDYKAAGKSLKSHLDDYVQYLAREGLVIHDLNNISTHPLPLAFSELPLVPQRQVALIGDAAAMIDPFTGEGIHFGIWAGYALGRAVSEGLREQCLLSAMERFETTYTDKFDSLMEDSQQLRVMLRFQRMLI